MVDIGKVIALNSRMLTIDVLVGRMLELLPRFDSVAHDQAKPKDLLPDEVLNLCKEISRVSMTLSVAMDPGVIREILVRAVTTGNLSLNDVMGTCGVVVEKNPEVNPNG